MINHFSGMVSPEDLQATFVSPWLLPLGLSLCREDRLPTFEFLGSGRLNLANNATQGSG